MGQWDDTEQAKTDMLQEHIDKVGPEEPTAKETAKQWAFGGPKDESWSDTAKRWGKAFVDFHNKKFSK
jgi:hypothetical protein